METPQKSAINYQDSLGKYYLPLMLLWACCLIFTAFQTERYEHVLLFTGFGLSFVAYVIMVKYVRLNQLKMLIAASLFVRFILIFAFPKLSDDIYRFIWDGRCWLNGIHPFSFTPEKLMEHSKNLIDPNGQLYSKLNSSGYFTIYPGICQIVFYLSSLVSPHNIMLNTILIKFFLFSCEIITIFTSLKILENLQIPKTQILWYAMNPLIILEICGNAHFEGAMITFLALSLLSFYAGKELLGSVFISLSVASKMLTAMFYPMIGFYELKNRRFQPIGYLIVFTLLFSLPILFNFNILKSLNLYFSKFEFNAGIYYLLRWLGYKLTGYNQIHIIGPLLSFLSGFLILTVSYLNNERTKWPFTMLWVFTIYLLLATTLHPWYVSMLLFLGVFNNYRFPVVWSFLIFLTYINYQHTGFSENLTIVWLEYSIIIFLVIRESGLFKKLYNLWIRVT